MINNKQEKYKAKIEDAINEHPEIRQALEAMERIYTVENKNAKNIFEKKQVYTLLK